MVWTIEVKNGWSIAGVIGQDSFPPLCQLVPFPLKVSLHFQGLVQCQKNTISQDRGNCLLYIIGHLSQLQHCWEESLWERFLIYHSRSWCCVTYQCEPFLSFLEIHGSISSFTFLLPFLLSLLSLLFHGGNW